MGYVTGWTNLVAMRPRPLRDDRLRLTDADEEEGKSEGLFSNEEMESDGWVKIFQPDV